MSNSLQNDQHRIALAELEAIKFKGYLCDYPRIIAFVKANPYEPLILKLFDMIFKIFEHPYMLTCVEIYLNSRCRLEKSLEMTNS